MDENIISEYHKRIDALFDDWKTRTGTVEYQEKRKKHTLHIDHQNEVFIRDGVVCPEQWFYPGAGRHRLDPLLSGCGADGL